MDGSKNLRYLLPWKPTCFHGNNKKGVIGGKSRGFLQLISVDSRYATAEQNMCSSGSYGENVMMSGSYGDCVMTSASYGESFMTSGTYGLGVMA